MFWKEVEHHYRNFICTYLKSVSFIVSLCACATKSKWNIVLVSRKCVGGFVLYFKRGNIFTRGLYLNLTYPRLVYIHKSWVLFWKLHFLFASSLVYQCPTKVGICYDVTSNKSWFPIIIPITNIQIYEAKMETGLSLIFYYLPMMCLCYF